MTYWTYIVLFKWTHADNFVVGSLRLLNAGSSEEKTEAVKLNT